MIIVLAATAVPFVAAPSAYAYPQGALACVATGVHVAGGADAPQANPSAVPCGPDSSSRAAAQANGDPGTAELTAGAVSTTAVLHDVPVDGDNGTARASADGSIIVSGATVISATGLATQATVRCVDGNPVMTGTSVVGALTINGASIALTGGPQAIPTAAGPLYVNAVESPAPNVLLQRALWLKTVRGDIVSVEAAVGYVDQPCQNGSPPPPPPPTLSGFGCYGSALRDNGDAPFDANPRVGPCITSTASGASASAASASVSASGLYATTSSRPNPLPDYSTATPYPEGASASASAGASQLSTSMGSGIRADSVGAKATSTCRAGRIGLTSGSQVHGLVVGGAPLPDTTMPMDIPLPGGSTLHLNWIRQNSVYVERRALWLQADNSGENVVIGDVLVGANTSPC